MEMLLQPGAPSGLRKKALTLVTDFWILPDVEGGDAAAEEEKLLAMAVMPHVVEMLGHGPPDTREKAMAALRAAVEGDGSEESAAAAARMAVIAAAEKHDAVPALYKLQEYFAAEAKEDPDVADYMTDLAQEAAALADTLMRHGGGDGGGNGRDEL